MYSPTLGRFLQTDQYFNQDGLNNYAYVGNNPVDLVDPTGNFGEPLSFGWQSNGLPGAQDAVDPHTFGGATWGPNDFGNPSGGFGLVPSFNLFGSEHYDREVPPDCPPFGARDCDPRSWRLTPFEDADGRACLTSPAFNRAVRHPDFEEVLTEAALGHNSTGYEHSFAFGPVLWIGPEGFSGPNHMRSSGYSHGGAAGLIRNPRITFHTHGDARPMLSGDDRRTAVRRGHPIVVYDIDDGTFRCALP